jgi:hypothetical protein
MTNKMDGSTFKEFIFGKKMKVDAQTWREEINCVKHRIEMCRHSYRMLFM